MLWEGRGGEGVGEKVWGGKKRRKGIEEKKKKGRE